jgi:hypothetical protein
MTSRLRSLLVIGCALVAALYVPENLALFHSPVRAPEALAAQAEPTELLADYAPAPERTPDLPADLLRARSVPNEPNEQKANLVPAVRRRSTVALAGWRPADEVYVASHSPAREEEHAGE